MLAAAPLLVHCKDQAPSDVYDLIIQNQSATNFEIWVNTTTGWAASGTVAAAGTVTLRNLRHGDSYTFRLSAVGTGPGTFVHERVVTSIGPDVTWTVT